MESVIFRDCFVNKAFQLIVLTCGGAEQLKGVLLSGNYLLAKARTYWGFVKSCSEYQPALQMYIKINTRYI